MQENNPKITAAIKLVNAGLQLFGCYQNTSFPRPRDQIIIIIVIIIIIINFITVSKMFS